MPNHVSSSEVYYFWQNTETNTHGVTIVDSENEKFSFVKEFTFDELSEITAPISEGGNGEGASWGDAVVSNDGSRIFVNGRNADKTVVINTKTREVEAILDVEDRPVHSFIYDDEVWVHVDGFGGFNVIDQNTLEVSEAIAANTVGTGHGKLLLSPSLSINTYATNTAEPAAFPINLETREVGAPITLGGGTHDKGYDPATGLAFFQLTDAAGFSFIDVNTNEVIYDNVPILGRVAETPDENYILILNADAEENDIGIWNTTLDTHTQPAFDSQVTIGGNVSVNGTEFYQDGEDWEAWIPQTSDDNVAVLNLTTDEVDLIDVGDLSIPDGVRHFSRRGESDNDYFFTYADEGAKRIDLDTHEVSSNAVPLGGQISRIAVVESEPVFHEIMGTRHSDILQGTPDADFIRGRKGQDQIFGGRGDDSLAGGRGQDQIFGGRGHDSLAGGRSQDQIFGGQGHDFLAGGRGQDQVFGGMGQDTLRGGAGSDLLDGGKGADSITLEIGMGIDIIQNFQINLDTLVLPEGLAVDQLGLSLNGGNTLIQLLETNKTLAILEGLETDIDNLSFIS